MKLCNVLQYESALCCISKKARISEYHLHTREKQLKLLLSHRQVSVRLKHIYACHHPRCVSDEKGRLKSPS